MKTTNVILLLALAVIASIVLTHYFIGPGAVPSNVVIKPDIKLHVTGSPKELIIKTLGRANCRASNSLAGCITVSKGDTALISYEIQTSPGWYFSQFKICKGNKANKDADDLDCKLTFRQRADFEATDGTTGGVKLYPDENGVIYLTQFSDELARFYLDDSNVIDEDYFYRIEACNAGVCLLTDPPIINGGRH